MESLKKMLSDNFILILIFTLVLFIIIGVFVAKRFTRLEKQSKETLKINNEVTNLKYALQSAVDSIQDIKKLKPETKKPETEMEMEYEQESNDENDDDNEEIVEMESGSESEAESK